MHRVPAEPHGPVRPECRILCRPSAHLLMGERNGRMEMGIVIKPIGVVRSPVREGIDQNWGNTISEVHLEAEFKDGLKGLQAFSHVIVVLYLHKSSFDAEQHLVRRPQGRSDMPMVGIFAQRAKHRPNPLGITVARILEVKENVLFVQGLDAIDETPVIDLKPYYPVYDLRGDARVPDWVDVLMKDYF
jgi:tRNA-Thr(GGU) m(6)t(6)A37 methyltransferase TsaA